MIIQLNKPIFSSLLLLIPVIFIGIWYQIYQNFFISQDNLQKKHKISSSSYWTPFFFIIKKIKMWEKNDKFFFLVHYKQIDAKNTKKYCERIPTPSESLFSHKFFFFAYIRRNKTEIWTEIIIFSLSLTLNIYFF